MLFVQFKLPTWNNLFHFAMRWLDLLKSMEIVIALEINHCARTQTMFLPANDHSKKLLFNKSYVTDSVEHNKIYDATCFTCVDNSEYFLQINRTIFCYYVLVSMEYY